MNKKPREMSTNIFWNIAIEMARASCLMQGSGPANTNRANVEHVKQEEI
jgi:hypothetical protein